jgi:monoamine oxidase
MDLDHIWYPSYGYHGGRGVIVGYYNTGKHSDVYTRLSPAEREARAVAQGIKIHGDRYRTQLASSFSVAWTRERWIEGGWAKTAGDYHIDDPVYAPLGKAAGRVYFAGDWLSSSVSWQHGALTAAQKAVTALHQRVLAT